MTMAEKVAKIALIFRALNRKMSWPLKPFQLGLRLLSKLRQTQWENNCKLQIVKCANKKGSIVPNEFSCLAEGSSIIIVCTTLHHYLMPPSAPIFKSPPMHDEKSIFTEHTHPHPPPCCTAAAHMPPKV